MCVSVCLHTWSPLIWWGFFTTSLTKCRMLSVCRVLSDFTRSTMVSRASLATGKTWRGQRCKDAGKYSRADQVTLSSNTLQVLPCFYVSFYSSCCSTLLPVRPSAELHTGHSEGPGTVEFADVGSAHPKEYYRINKHNSLTQHLSLLA